MSDDTRAERAFRDAFARHAEDLETQPLRVVRRRRWSLLVAAAVVLVLVGAAGLAAVVRDDPSGPDPVADTATSGVLPAATPGWRWATWRDVGVEVPETWVDDDEPGEDWCADTGRPVKPAAPYVARANDGFVLSIGCHGEQPPKAFGPAPLRLMVPHISFAVPGELADGETTEAGWTATVRTAGDVQVRLYTDAGTADVVDHVLGSIRTYTTDHHGCDVTSPVRAEEFVRPAPFDVAAVESVESISICQYDRSADPDAVALMASRRVEGADADALLAGIRTAPAGGGPDRPQSCVEDMYGDTGLAVRLHHDGRTDDLYAYYDWCFGNGYDDGTTRRALTADNCAPLFGGTVVAWSYGSFMASRCGRVGPRS